MDGQTERETTQVVSDIEPKKDDLDSSGASRASHASQGARFGDPTDQQDVSHASQTCNESSQSSLTEFGINDACEKTITSDMVTAEVESNDEQAQEADDDISKTQQIFSRLEDYERQSNQGGQFVEISVSEVKFHEALESSGISLEVIEEMGLEKVFLEDKGGCYRRKGDAL